ncbi:MAG: hypothetical protein AB7L09_00235 [Nitrospira sp.]
MAKKKPSQKKKQTQASIDEFKKKFDDLEDKRKKGNAQAIERRRQDVWEMMCQDIPQTEMSQLLNVARSTIALDVKYLRDKAASRVQRMKEGHEFVNDELGMTIEKLDSVSAAAFMEYSMAKSGGEKAKFLDIIAKTLSTKTRILQDAGFLPKAGIEIRTKIEKLPSFADRFGDDNPLKALDNANSRHRLLGLAKKMLDLANRDANTIDVDGMVKPDDADGQPMGASLVPLK